jgi:transaldolase
MSSHNPLCKLEQFEQSIWLDFLSRDMIQSGQLQKLIDDDGVKGVTSNPSIFQKALSAGSEYDEEIRRLASEGKTPEEIFTVLSVEDVQHAADMLRPTWERLHHGDGFVSLEVNPHLAYDTEATIDEARKLWGLIDRPNAFIKVPATAPGLDAIRRLISEGININVTLLFGLPRYVEVTEAYMRGLEERAAHGKPVDDVHSVASFFLSRIDVLVDPELERLVERGGEKADTAERFVGQTAIASAREAYRLAGHTFGHERFLKLKERGARIQRLLWASTSTKNPKYPDTKYVESLIAPQTINTLPLETLEAYRDHGDPAVRIKDDLDLTDEVLNGLSELGVDLADVTKQLEKEGVEKFNESYDKLIASLAKKREEALQPSGAS